MKALVLALCLLTAPVFAQEICLQGSFPPQSMEDVEILSPEGWQRGRVERISSTLSPSMEGVQLRYKDASGKEHHVWVVFSLSEDDGH